MSPRFFSFGTLSDGTEVTAGRLENTAGASLTVLDYGATIQSICVPDREGNLTMIWSKMTVKTTCTAVLRDLTKRCGI